MKISVPEIYHPEKKKNRYNVKFHCDYGHKKEYLYFSSLHYCYYL